MLVLTRAPGERILIDGGIVITILGFKGRQCRVGIECPRDIGIQREEVADKIDRERRRDAEDGDPSP
jgi:carbon storage regulator